MRLIKLQMLPQAIIPQNVVATSDKPHEVVKIYQKDTLIGILNNTESFESNFDRVYEAEYKDKFENSKLGPSKMSTQQRHSATIHTRTKTQKFSITFTTKDYWLLKHIKLSFQTVRLFT
ncbi:hypothetical protein MGH68_00100 [Erysipelothrix sp. D19-032]